MRLVEQLSNINAVSNHCGPCGGGGGGGGGERGNKAVTISVLNHLQYSHTVPLVSLSPLPTDPTFTLSNVTSAVGIRSVQDWNNLGYYLDVPKKRRGSREGMLQYFITTMPNASWQTLAGGLYYRQEQATLERVMKYFQRQPGMGGWGLRSIV